jgi:RNA polymerase sigma-70 factor (ECF subfamily)
MTDGDTGGDPGGGDEDVGDLATRIAGGRDPGAEGELVLRFAGRIRLYGIRHLRSEDQAAELVQEVLAIVIEALRASRVEDPRRVDRFILGTCRNVVSGWRRGERRRTALAATLAHAPAVTPPVAPESRRLLDCLMRLDGRERSVLVLSYIEEREAAEVGGLLGLTAANVRVIRHRALLAIRLCLGRSG